MVPAALRAVAVVAGREGQGPKVTTTTTTTGRRHPGTGTSAVGILAVHRQRQSSRGEGGGEEKEEEEGEGEEGILCSSRGAAAAAVVASRLQSTRPLVRTVGGHPCGNIRALSTTEWGWVPVGEAPEVEVGVGAGGDRLRAEGGRARAAAVAGAGGALGVMDAGVVVGRKSVAGGGEEGEGGEEVRCTLLLCPASHRERVLLLLLGPAAVTVRTLLRLRWILI